MALGNFHQCWPYLKNNDQLKPDGWLRRDMCSNPARIVRRGHRCNMQEQMKTKIEKITPEIATEILERHNPRNRSVSESTVQIYATDMKNGKWKVTHQGIAFDVNGNLLDGQHRLWACVFSGITIEILVTRDLPVETESGYTMEAIDRTRVRTTGQNMQLCHSIKNGNQVAAALRVILSMASPKLARNRLSNATAMMLHGIYGTNLESLLRLMPSASCRKGFILGPLALYHKGEPEKASQFTTELVTLENMSAPARGIKKFLDDHPSTGMDIKVLNVISNAVHAFHHGRVVQKFHSNDTGREWLLGMFPSTIKMIVEEATPCRITIANNRKIVI